MKKLLLLITFFTCQYELRAQVIYGNNLSAGHYFNTGDAKIYYEVYGKGKPLVLLHGGIWGYIDEYSKLIPVLSHEYQVIAIATRGHGKSEIGKQPFSYQLFADDAWKIIRHITNDSVTVIGFSDGADQGYLLAAQHPELIKKLIAIGGDIGFNDLDKESQDFTSRLNSSWFKANQQDFIKERKMLMPEQQRFDEFIDRMANLWQQPAYVTKDQLRSIKCPTTIIAGQNDGCPPEQYVAFYHELKNGQLAIIPGSDHLVLQNKPQLVQHIILTYLHNETEQ